MLKTAVIGAGPAGLLFTFIGKLLMGSQWQVTLYDKRTTYARTHRLRLDREPYEAIQKELDDRRFDEFIAFLEEHHFSPEVNRLEEKLQALLLDLGVVKEIRSIDTLTDLDVDTVVAADSVHSTIADLAPGGNPVVQGAFERVARLRVTGKALPSRLTVLDQFRLSKVLGSVVDYRVNKNGFAEADLFLTEAEYARVRALGASPKAPVALTTAREEERFRHRSDGRLNRVSAPLFAAVVHEFERGGHEVTLHSTFELQHSVRARVTFQVGKIQVFLLGDAAVSLPFFRGMACLATCAQALARTHAARTFESYAPAVARIVAHELAVVRARAFLVRTARELVRLSALLPFPIQAWWLSAAHEPLPERWSAGAYFNLVVAVSAAGMALLGLWFVWVPTLVLPIQLLGGVAYRWTLALEPGPHRYLRLIWQVQIVLLAAVGLAAALTARMLWLAVFGWWFAGVFFALGIYVFERLVARWLRGARLEEFK